MSSHIPGMRNSTPQIYEVPHQESHWFVLEKVSILGTISRKADISNFVLSLPVGTTHSPTSALLKVSEGTAEHALEKSRRMAQSLFSIFTLYLFLCRRRTVFIRKLAIYLSRSGLSELILFPCLTEDKAVKNKIRHLSMGHGLLKEPLRSSGFTHGLILLLKYVQFCILRREANLASIIGHVTLLFCTVGAPL